VANQQPAAKKFGGGFSEKLPRVTKILSATRYAALPGERQRGCAFSLSLDVAFLLTLLSLGRCLTAAVFGRTGRCVVSPFGRAE
jgi:hypothetical protein